jgi:hypothetical protein
MRSFVILCSISHRASAAKSTAAQIIAPWTLTETVYAGMDSGFPDAEW